MVFGSFETVLDVELIFKNKPYIGGNFLNKLLTKSLNYLPVIMEDNIIEVLVIKNWPVNSYDEHYRTYGSTILVWSQSHLAMN